MSTSLQGIAQKAQNDPEHRFGNLYELLNEAFLHECWGEIRRDAACGIDWITAQEYEQNLVENIHNLVERLKQQQYRAPASRRHYIPKGDGKWRSLGIPTVEDKLLQRAVMRILQAIYEQDFMRCSYGYRPGRGALDAVDQLTIKLQFGKYHVVVEADIQGFFDNLDHDLLMKMLEERIEDSALLKLIRKWLKAGVLDTDGKMLHPLTGTPQGGIISPMLANVYLHHALDLWFHQEVKKHCQGEACLIRYADDFVCAFQYQVEAEWFYEQLGDRLKRFGLELSAAKTRIIPFSGQRKRGKTSFDFLGFEFRWGKDKKGKPHLKRRTSRKKLRTSFEKFTEWCRKARRYWLSDLMKELKAKLRGYYNYYGVIGNHASLKQFYEGAKRILLKWLNRRSQKRSYTKEGFYEMLQRYGMVSPRIVGRPKRRGAEGTI